jgi:hypothetical protein
MMGKLELKSTSTAATTYHFLTAGDGWRSWALCTVNDVTGELLITSDWGNWSYRWNTDTLGCPTLTAFIGGRDAVDYIARKLQGRHGGQRFSAERTIAAWRRMLRERRAEVGHTRDHKLTRALAREIWDALGDAADDCGQSADLFLARVYEIDGFTDHVDDTPYESIETEQTPEDRSLRDLILPALIAACTETHRKRPTEPAPPAEGATK